MKKTLFLFSLILIFSCNNKPKVISNKTAFVKKEIKPTIKNDTIETPNQFVLAESFKDSTTVGLKGKNKVVLEQYNKSDSSYVVINLFEKSNKNWVLKQKLNYPKDGITSSDTQISDFNNDGLNDLTFQSDIAARGANELRTLLIFDKENKKFRHIKNSSNYPNLQYNKTLNCIDAWFVYGGTSTVFLKIEPDSLREFAGIEEIDGYREIYTVDKKGNHKRIKKEKIKNSEEGDFNRYTNFNPLE